MQAGVRPSLVALVLLVCGCIERPWQDAQGRPAVDRSTLRDVLLSAPPAGMVPVRAVFGGQAELVGYQVEPSKLVAGQRASLTLVWRCKAEMDAWHIFVHLDDASGSGQRIHAEHDPAQGRYPTDDWRPGDLIADAVSFVPQRFSLLLYVGFYSEGDTRLHLDIPGSGKDDGANRLFVASLAVQQ
jgi:hypothetical protein